MAKKAAPPDFHHVTLSVSGVTEMELERGDQQLDALVTVKMDYADAVQLRDILQAYIERHAPGLDRVGFTLTGRFT